MTATLMTELTVKDIYSDPFAAWSKGGKTSVANCQMACKSHNRAKGNR